MITGESVNSILDESAFGQIHYFDNEVSLTYIDVLNCAYELASQS